MKSLPYIVLSALIFYACSARKKEKPAILEEKKIDVSSIYRKQGVDVVEALYEEVVKQSDYLKKLEEDIKEIKASWPDSLDDFKAYHDKNDRYYKSANKKAEAITDSLLRKGILDMLKQSRQQYLDSISPLTRLDSLLQTRSAVIDNLHILLKLAVTMPVIESFQRTNQPYSFAIDPLTRRMDTMIVVLDSMTRRLNPLDSVTAIKK